MLSLCSDVQRGWGEGCFYLQGQYDPRLQEQRENPQFLCDRVSQGAIIKHVFLQGAIIIDTNGLFVFVTASVPPGILRYQIDYIFYNLSWALADPNLQRLYLS